MAPNYDLYGSDYSFTSGKGLSSSFFNVPGTHITNYGDKGAIAGLIPHEFVSNTSSSDLKQDVVDVFTDPRGLEIAIREKLGGDNSNEVSDNPYYYDPGSASGSAPSTSQELQYIDAPYAEMYGMDASTAYQEALANTAYQRKVRDLKAAGLNPVLGYSGAGSDSFYGTPAVSSYGGVSYGSLGSGKSTSLSESATKLQYWLPTLVNGVTNMAFTLGTKNGMTGYAAGTIAQNMVSGALGAIRNHST